MSAIKDTFSILKYLSFLRISNLFKLYFSFIISRIIRRPIVWGKPFTVSIEPTTACNLGCPECPSGLKAFTRPTGKLAIETNQQLLKSIGRQLMYVNYYFQGEPFLNPDFLNLVKDAKKQNLYVATSTNAHFISTDVALDIVQSGLDRLIISIDGVTQETYQSYRVTGKLDKVIEATKELVKAKKELKSHTPHLIFQFLVVKPNEHEIPAIFELSKELGVDEVRLKTAQLYDYKNGHALMPANEKYTRYKLQKNGTYALKYAIQNHCWRMWSSCVFTWDGQVVPCCFDKDASYPLGNATTIPFQTLWKSEKYQGFRKMILTGRKQVDICQNCSEGTKVWL
jgi:radical SAM protein with 4Fe4S-binding SPASM domain